MTEEQGNYEKLYPTVSTIKELWEQYMERATQVKTKEEAARLWMEALHVSHKSGESIPLEFTKSMQMKFPETNSDVLSDVYKRLLMVDSIMSNLDLISEEIEILRKCDKGEELTASEVQFILSNKERIYDLDKQFAIDSLPMSDDILVEKEKRAEQLAESIRTALERFKEKKGGEKDEVD